MSSNILDRISAKSLQILSKADKFSRSDDLGTGNNLTGLGMFLGAGSILLGMGGVIAMIAAPVSAIGLLAAASVGAVNIAGATLLGGGATGVATMALGKLYNVIRGSYDVESSLQALDSNVNVKTLAGTTEVLSSVGILKSLESGEFFKKYKGFETTKGYQEPTKDDPIEKYVRTIGTGVSEFNHKTRDELAMDIRKDMFVNEKNIENLVSLNTRISKINEIRSGNKSLENGNPVNKKFGI